MLKHITQALRALFYGSALFSFAISINIVQICSMLLIPFSRKLVWKINSRGAQSMWWVMQYIFEKRHKGSITFSGDKIPSDESAIVISNHKSFTDFYMLHSLAIRRNMLPHVKYFAKDSLKYIPFFGFGMWLMGMIFIKRNWTQDEGQLKKIFRAIKKYAAPIWVVNFLEGTRFTQKKLQESQAFARERGLPILQNLLLPRTKGFVACVRQLKNTHVKYVYDFTIAYQHIRQGLQYPPNLVQIHALPLITPPWSFHVHIRRYAIEDLPSDEKNLVEWVKNIFVEKDAILEDMKVKWTKSDKLGSIRSERYFN
ncbi:8155_t:CDS:2 [Funneliformis caledonium]|uniref:8155_t:CDS:1 n=1 Tax=Funneliformis caledonium TaxID=1117310 RepID=A0A9N9H2L2_9GLOM|nr:8155_t:CDS:2 [Funneliformis caledonium]